MRQWALRQEHISNEHGISKSWSNIVSVKRKEENIVDILEIQQVFFPFGGMVLA
jgi:hypothetical protein